MQRTEEVVWTAIFLGLCAVLGIAGAGVAL